MGSNGGYIGDDTYPRPGSRITGMYGLADVYSATRRGQWNKFDLQVRALGPTAYWPLTDPAGNAAAGEHANLGHAFSINPGGVTFGAAGLIGSDAATSATVGTANGDRLVCPVYAPSTAVSVVVAFKRAAATGNHLMFGNFLGSGLPTVDLRMNSSGQLQYHQYLSSSTSGRMIVSTSGTYDDDSPHIAVVTWDRAGDKKARIYVDGTLVLTTSAWDNDIYNNGAQFAIGGRSSATESFGGTLGRVGLWVDRALSSAEIAALDAAA